MGGCTLLFRMGTKRHLLTPPLALFHTALWLHDIKYDYRGHGDGHYSFDESRDYGGDKWAVRGPPGAPGPAGASVACPPAHNPANSKYCNAL